MTTDRRSISFRPTLIIDHTSISLTEEQQTFLSRGPTYVPFGQRYISTHLYPTQFDLVLKQSKSLRRELIYLFSKFPFDLRQSMIFEDEIHQLFLRSFSLSLPSSLEKRAYHEKHLIQSIRTYLQTNHLILRRLANQQNTFYLGDQKEFQCKIHHYWQSTITRYEFMANSPTTLIEQLNMALNRLQQNKLTIDLPTKLKFPTIYFLPQFDQVSRLIHSFIFLFSISCLEE